MNYTRQSVRHMSEDELSEMIRAVLEKSPQRNNWRLVELVVLSLIGAMTLLAATVL